jgi:adhesin transport system membrane fusion protein
MVQSLDGGVVVEILVREGQLVEAGQLLLRVDETRAGAGVRESASQGFSLRARAARLRALAEGSVFVAPKGRDPDEERVAVDARRLYESRVSELASTLAVNRQQLAQKQQELSEMQSKRVAALRGLDLTQQELAQTRPLLTTGAVSQVDVLRLEREVARYRGDVDQTAAQIARAEAAIGEVQRKAQETEIAFRNEARKELGETMAKLNALNEGAVALADKVDKASVKSPVRARAAAACQHGGWRRAAGQGHRRDRAAGRHAGARGPCGAERHRVHPPRASGHGEVQRLRFFDLRRPRREGGEHLPDSVVDERGNAYYLVRVRTVQAGFSEKLPIIPGMTAEVDVLTGRKSVLSYLLKPVLKVQRAR